MEELKTGLAEFGQEAKVADSYASTSYFSFSHDPSIGTTELPQTYRKILKCMGNNNALMNTLDEKVGAAYSNAHSAAKVSVCPTACYSVGLFWALFHIKQVNSYAGLSFKHLQGLLLVPSLTGGLPTIYTISTNVQKVIYYPIISP